LTASHLKRAPSTETYPLSLHDALPIFKPAMLAALAMAVRTTLTGSMMPALTISTYSWALASKPVLVGFCRTSSATTEPSMPQLRSEEHTSELQSLTNLVCRLLLDKKTYEYDRRPHHGYRVRDFRRHIILYCADLRTRGVSS